MSFSKVNKTTGELTQIAGLVDIDTTPTEGSAHAVQSGGTFNAIKAVSDDVDELSSQMQTLSNQVDDISDEIADMNNVLGAKNLLPNNAVSKTVNGVTFTVNSDGSVTVNGTATADISYFVNTSFTLKKGIYILSMPFSSPTAFTEAYVWIRDSNNQSIVFANNRDKEFTLTSDTVCNCVLMIANGYSITNKIFYPMIRPASITDDTYVPYSMTNREMTPYVQAISNPNLLDNPWFTINQRGQSSYSTTGADYTFDRWFSFDGNTSVVQNADGSITLGAVEGVSKAVYLRQKIENTNKLLGKTATISLLKDDNTIITATGDIPSTVPSSQTGVAYAYIIENGVIFGTVSITFLPNSYVVASISAYAGKSVTFKAVKIELGSVSTLAMDTAPNYATELLKCQRYFVDMGGIQVLFASSEQGTRAFSSPIRWPVNMRANPSINVYEEDSYAAIIQDVKAYNLTQFGSTFEFSSINTQGCYCIRKANVADTDMLGKQLGIIHLVASADL